jgi:hypothetical protein
MLPATSSLPIHLRVQGRVPVSRYTTSARRPPSPYQLSIPDRAFFISLFPLEAIIVVGVVGGISSSPRTNGIPLYELNLK